DRAGTALLRLPAGPAIVTVVHLGFHPETLQVVVPAGNEIVIPVTMRAQPEELQRVVVTSTRVSHDVANEPNRVEVLAGEEIGEKTETRPGDLTQLLLEMSGVRVQPTAPALGSAAVRIQGLPGQYTQVLTDGLPLAGAQFGELNLAQVPPLDLQRVEVIKGPATALYGPSAMAGVVNLVTRPPTETERDIVVNQTSQSGSDAVGWLSQHFSDHWGATLLAGAHHQSEDDINGDGWADVAGFRRVEVRPRIYWTPRAGTSLLATAGGMTEYRIGGTLPGA